MTLQQLRDELDQLLKDGNSPDLPIRLRVSVDCDGMPEGESPLLSWELIRTRGSSARLILSD